MPRSLVAEVPDRAAVEARDAADRRRLLARHRRQGIEWISLPQLECAGLGSDERVAREPLAAFHALQQEAGLAGRAQQCVRANWGEHVGQNLPVDRDQGKFAGQAPSCLSAGSAAGKARSGRASRAC